MNQSKPYAALISSPGKEHHLVSQHKKLIVTLSVRVDKFLQLGGKIFLLTFEKTQRYFKVNDIFVGRRSLFMAEVPESLFQKVSKIWNS